MQVVILGLGNLGTAIANLVAQNGHDVLCWEHDREVVDEVNKKHSNSRYLKGIALPENISATGYIEQALQHGDMIINCLPSRFILETLEPVSACLAKEVPLVNMAKGIDRQSRQTASQQLGHLFPENPLVMLAGPSLANEFSRGVNTVVVAACEDRVVAQRVADLMANDHFTVLLSDDVVGVELGGILKNIYAIGLGAAHTDGSPGLNFIGAYLTQALGEMQRIGMTLGANAESFYSFAGIGDLVATAMSEQSHNYRFGKLIGSGMTLAEAGDKAGLFPEGVNTLQVMAKLADEQQLDLPLLRALQQLLDEGGDIRRFNHWS